MKFLLILFAIVFTGCVQAEPIFKIISYPDLKPLKNHKVVLYSGDVRLKMARGTNPYPYKIANKKSWYLDELKTDDSGLLTFNKTYDCRSIILVIGEQYKNIRFSFSNNLSHNYSGYHIRIVDCVPGATQVQGNYIYNLKNKEVTYFKIDGNKTVKKFKYIKIQAIKKKDLPKQTAKEFKQELIGYWRAIAIFNNDQLTYDTRNCGSYILQCELKTNNTAAITVVRNKIKQEISGTYSVEFERKPQVGCATIARILIHYNAEDLVLRRVMISNGQRCWATAELVPGAPYLTVDEKPYGYLTKNRQRKN